MASLMPTVSRFYGISILVNYRNEHPPAHFHAYYGDFEAVIQISPPGVIQGKLPPRILGMVMEWAAMHEADLLEAWEDAIHQRPVKQIDPLP
jgi:hypothetical protein